MDAEITEVTYSYVEEDKLPQNLIDSLKNCKTVSMDTEADSLHHYYDKVCLIQTNINGNIFIIDPLICKDLDTFFGLLKDKTLIFHGADYDIRILKRDFDFIPYKVFDTMLATQLLGYEKLGLIDLTEKHFGIKLSKGPQKMDWSIRPLPDNMLKYAVNDVRYLPQLYNILVGELNESKRLEWLNETCRHLIETSVAEKETEDEDLWRIKGSYDLNRSELNYLKELWFWREKEAGHVDLPVFRILKNDSLITLAKWSVQEKPLSESPVYSLISHWKNRLQRLERTISRASKIMRPLWPKIKRPAKGKRKDVDPHLFELLKQKRDEIAGQLQIDPAIILNHRSLTAVSAFNICSERFINNGDPDLPHVHNWQKELLWPSFEKIISNYKAGLTQNTH